jgi:hypothetical protein
VWLGALPAEASEWATRIPRAQSQGDGVRVGDRSTLHPGFALAIGGDTNLYRVRPSEGIDRGAFLTPTGWVRIGNRPIVNGRLDTPAKATPSKFDYALDAAASYRQFMSGNPAVRAAGKFNGALGAHFAIFPGRRLTVTLDEKVARVGEPQNFEAAREFNFNRIDHSGRLGLIFRPGGGRLSLGVGGINRVLYFESASLTTGDRTVNGLDHETKWRFLDRTALVARYSYLYYYHFCCAEAGSGRNEDSAQHRAVGGLTGQLGRRWTFDVLGGFGWGLYKDDTNGPSHRNVLFNAALAFYPTRRTSLRVSAHRKFDDSLFGNYFTDLGGRFEVAHTFKIGLSLFGGVLASQRRFAGLPQPGVETQSIASYEGTAPGLIRTDLIMAVHARLEQALGRLFAVGVSYDLLVDSTDFRVTYVNGWQDVGGYTRNVIMGYGAVRY